MGPTTKWVPPSLTVFYFLCVSISLNGTNEKEL